MFISGTAQFSECESPGTAKLSSFSAFQVCFLLLCDPQSTSRVRDVDLLFAGNSLEPPEGTGQAGTVCEQKGEKGMELRDCSDTLTCSSSS